MGVGASMGYFLLAIGIVIVLARQIAQHRRTNLNSSQRSVIFIHPDLGIGGAERLVIDLASGLSHFHRCQTCILTTSFDESRCFAEVANSQRSSKGNPSNSHLNVIVRGNSFPRSIQGRLVRLCKSLSMVYAVTWLVLYGPVYEAFVVDQISIALPILRLLLGNTPKIVFYCHFPDHLCNPWKDHPSRVSRLVWTRVYTALFNALEKWSFRFADIILFNSQYTKAVAGKFLSVTGKVLYPPMKGTAHESTKEVSKVPDMIKNLLSPKVFLILSVSRFEPKKNPMLAVRMLAHIVQMARDARRIGFSQKNTPIHLVLCGGYDTRLMDNRVCMEEIQEWLTAHPTIKRKISIFTNISECIKWQLLHRADLVVYTPENEHFGIVPVEAMSCGKSVVASNTGGLLETVGLSGVYGVLVDANPKCFATAVLELFNDNSRRDQIGCDARERVRSMFSLEKSSRSLYDILFS
ncbi:glycosyltransferase ALG2 [Perkinsela sp. CCAP 1560/4]|nr:glycosyltransferase ALG2 [Perkinsela sp. CCAP 1560/4]|eukprot:KNH07471.1 glycosyltransferase ALG2 [Perkinsela sp. CCAP 1560/4]